jgi:serine/threonine-protein kinase HipA
VNTFIKGIAFNWIVAGTDAHAKNYSLLIRGGLRVRLAPLYDIESVLPYDEFNMSRVNTAMKTGGEYGLRDISIRNWIKMAKEVRIDSERLISQHREMPQQLPDHLRDAGKQARRDKLDHLLIGCLIERLTGRILDCNHHLTGTGAR